MKARFSRDMNCNYLILPLNCSSYQITMFCKNEIDGFLNGKIKSGADGEEVLYDISSKQNILRAFERKEFGFDEVRNFFYSWKNAVNEAERYLLNPVFLLCHPEYIYYNLSEKTFHRVFYPENEPRELPDGLKDLSEFLLERVNRRDYEALDVVYRFHHDVKDGNFYLKEIIKMIEEIKVRNPEGMESEETEEFLLQDTPLKDLPPEKKEPEILKEEGFGERMLGKIGRLFSGKKKDLKMAGSRKEAEIPKRTETEEVKAQSISPGRTWMEEEYEEEKPGKTVLIRPACQERVLVRVKDKKTYSLENLPIVIGKLEGDVDIVLNDPSISRLHARFFEENGKVYLEDLNSTNGCALNAIPLQTNEKAEVAMGDTIRIGAVEFVYGGIVPLH